jgi:hypothetical protein
MASDSDRPRPHPATGSRAGAPHLRVMVTYNDFDETALQFAPYQLRIHGVLQPSG